MELTFHHIDKWGFANLDLVEETLENQKKAIVIIAGASSSGKSFAASYLKQLLEENGYHAFNMSLDQYNIGLSGIVPNKVNLNFFNGTLENMPEIRKKIKEIIYDIPFDEKYDEISLSLIRNALQSLIPEEKMETFINGLSTEWKRINFDETSVYDMHEASQDIKELLEGKSIHEKLYSKIVSERVRNDTIIDGKKVDVIIVEGIYALNEAFIDELNDLDIIKNFIDGNPKSLFLRRIIRDTKISSASSPFTINLYFKYIVKAYNETILPSRNNADVILNNDMTFSELRAGALYVTKDEVYTKNEKLVKDLIDHSRIQSTTYQKDIFFSVENENQANNNLLRFRETSLDGGKTYRPSSLVHKGALKTRKDSKLIRPINVLLKEDEIQSVWSTEEEVMNDFLYAGFSISKMERKTKIKLIYKDQPLTLREITNKGTYIEFDTPIHPEVIQEIKDKVKTRQS